MLMATGSRIHMQMLVDFPGRIHLETVKFCKLFLTSYMLYSPNYFILPSGSE
jgi:hypothetical protein